MDVDEAMGPTRRAEMPGHRVRRGVRLRLGQCLRVRRTGEFEERTDDCAAALAAGIAVAELGGDGECRRAEECVG